MLSPALPSTETILQAYVSSGLSGGWRRALEELSYPEEVSEQALEQFMRDATEVARHWAPLEVREAMSALSFDDAPACVYLSNLPIGEVGPVPSNGRRSAEKSSVSEGVLLGLAGLAGHPFAYRQELGGSLPQQIAPAYGKERTQSSQGRDLLDAHSDFAALRPDCRPEFLALLGLVNECSSETIVFPVEEVIERLSAAARQVLEQPLFRIAVPDTIHNSGVQLRPHPVLINRTISLSSGGIEPLSTAAKAALGELRVTIRTLRGYRFAIQPGEMLIFNNLRTVHARTAVTGKRWLQRTYFNRSLDTMRELDPTAAIRFDAARLAWI